MTRPGVGVIVALTFVSAVDDPARFRAAKAVGAHFGLTPRKYQSGETDVTGRISKIGDASVRTAAEHAPQLAEYARALEAATGRQVTRRVIHLPVGGALLVLD